ncbi:hypothetical protein YDYSY3_38210 [Paenibacillus chitinolyticus]|uniref:hypothetical protein n=1 Tax=Paenibacillus chitinolyticus TaxID=79263 RepID=UPI0026E4F563|nr:hypothetical protein [Paenibacillus chitinolyticus]GKS12821.1 hypothetical protein YDYSY3_38210 [Paenibacillus chitinolyticus]
MKRYELLEFTQFTKNKEMPKEIRKALIKFLQAKGYECILKNDLKKITYGQLREEFMTVLNPPANVQEMYRLFPLGDSDTASVIRWYIEIDPVYIEDVQAFLNTQVTDCTFPLVLLENADGIE